MFYRVFKNRLVKLDDGTYERVFTVSNSSCKIESEFTSLETNGVNVFTDNFVMKEYSSPDQEGEIRWELAFNRIKKIRFKVASPQGVRDESYEIVNSS